MEKRVIRACNACRLRKVKCNGQQPCAQCSHLNVACTFRAHVERRDRPVRGRLISQLRSNQVETKDKREPVTIAVRDENYTPSSATTTAAGVVDENSPDGVRETSLFATLPLDEIYFTGLIASYEKFAYPVNPIVTSAEILDSIQHMREDLSHTAFVYAFAAVTVNLTEVSSGAHNGDIKARIHDLGARSLAAKHEGHRPGGVDSGPELSVRRIMTCIFLEICAMACQQYERAFTVLQEAIAGIHLLRIDRPQRQGQGESEGNDVQRAELARRQRLYWEAFVHERFLTIVSGLPSTMQPLRTGLPCLDPTIPVHIHEGFIRIIRLFSIMNNEFLLYWTSQDLPEEERPLMTAEYIELKQTQLDDDEAEMAAMCEVDNADADKDLDGDDNGRRGSSVVLTGLQRADLFVTRMWQRVLVWQLGMSRCLLSSVPPASSHEAMSLVFPARRLGAQLRSLVSQLDPITSIGMHGSGILQKLFEITNTIADVLAMVPDAISRQTIDDFVFLVCVLLSFDRIDTVQRDILRMKIQSMNNTFSNIHIEGMVHSGLTEREGLG